MGKKLKLFGIISLGAFIGTFILGIMAWAGYNLVDSALTDISELLMNYVTNKYLIYLLIFMICVGILTLIGWKSKKIIKMVLGK